MVLEADTCIQLLGPFQGGVQVTHVLIEGGCYIDLRETGARI